MMTKPIRAKELYYPMIQFLIISIIAFFGEGGWGGGAYRYMYSNLSSVNERCWCVFWCFSSFCSLRSRETLKLSFILNLFPNNVALVILAMLIFSLMRHSSHKKWDEACNLLLSSTVVIFDFDQRSFQGIAKKILFPILPQFTQAFVQVLALQEGSPTVDCGLKMEVLKVKRWFLKLWHYWKRVQLKGLWSIQVINILAFISYTSCTYSNRRFCKTL